MFMAPGYASRTVLKRTRKDFVSREIERGAMSQADTKAAVLIGGDDLAFEGMKSLLVRNGFEIVGSASRLGDIDVSAARAARNLLVIVDVPGRDGAALKVLLGVRGCFADACVVLLLDGFQEIVDLLPRTLTANAILDRNASCEILVKTLRVAMAGYGVISPIYVGIREDTSEKFCNSLKGGTRVDVPANLSHREHEIIGFIAQGLSNKLIARRLSISEATVKIHVRGILRKINARNRTQAAIWLLHSDFGRSAVAAG